MRWSQNLYRQQPLRSPFAFNAEKMNEAHGRVLGANKIVLPADGNINIEPMAENFRLLCPGWAGQRSRFSISHSTRIRMTGSRIRSLKFWPASISTNSVSESSPSLYISTEDIDRHHIHIVTVNVNEQGKRLDQSFLFRRSKKITTELEEKYGLHKAQREKVSPDTPITKIDPNGDIKRQVQNTVKLVGMR